MDNYFSRKSGKTAKLTKHIGELYPELSYNFLMKLIRKRDVFVNGARANADSELKKGDLVSLFLLPKAVPVDICFENDYIFCVNKPKALQSDGDYSLKSLINYVKPESVMINRLDTNTSGLVLFAKGEEVADYIISAMNRGEIEKTYSATVYGEVNFKNTLIKGYLVKNADAGRVKIYHSPIKGSVEVSIICTTKAKRDGLTYLEVVLHNGKTHQIRAQLADAGYFIIGDGKYGNDKINRLYGYKSQELKAIKLKFNLSDDRYNLSGLVISL